MVSRHTGFLVGWMGRERVVMREKGGEVGGLREKAGGMGGMGWEA